ncbi:MAG: Abortive infection protein [Blastococcus sp.]|nr:Abortive infection protein [Blastococcus sp.]
MTGPGGQGHRAGEQGHWGGEQGHWGGEPYAGPPPTRRPEPSQWPIAPPQAPPWRPGSWGPPPAALPPQAGVRWAAPPGTAPHDVPRPFLLAMRARDWAWWRPLLGLVLLAVVYVVAAVVVLLLSLLTGIGPDLALLDLVDPVVLLVTNLSLIVAIPTVWLAWSVAHGMRPGWSSSVLARLRWRLLPRFAVVALVTLGTGIGLSVVLGFVLGDDEVTGPVQDFGWLLVVVLLTTPLQSAAEEYLFRGYLSQAIAGWVRAPRAGAVVAAVVTAALFSAAHAPPDFLTFLDRFLFGLAASAVVGLTGGLEAAIVLHAVNNVLVFVLAGALGDGVVTEEAPHGGGELFVLLSALAMGSYVALVARSRRRLRPELVTAAHDLRGSGPLAPARAG